MAGDFTDHPAATTFDISGIEQAIYDQEQGEQSPLDAPDALVRRDKMIDWWLQAREAQAVPRLEAALDHDYFDGLQWSDMDRQALWDRGQSPLVFNKIAPTVLWVSGTEKKTRIDYKVFPRGAEDLEGAEVKTKLLKYLADVNRAGFHRSRAFQDAIISGVGWMEHCIVNDPDDEPLTIRYEDWRNVWYDHLASEMDLQDARYLFRQRWLDVDLACAMFPTRMEQIKEAATTLQKLNYTDDDEFYTSANRILTDGRVYGEHRSSIGEFAYVQNRRARVKVIECWYREPCQCQIIKGAELGAYNGDLYDPTDEFFKWHLDRGKATIVNALKMRMRVGVFTGSNLLWEGESPYRHNRFPFVPIWCHRRKRDGTSYGIVRMLRDPQDDLNKRRSKAQWILSTNQIIADADAVEDWDNLRDEANRPDGVIIKKKGSDVQFRTDIALAQEHVNLMEQDAQYIQQASGITDENLGLETNAQSGKAVIARQQQGQVVTAGLFDNLRMAVQMEGEIDLSNIEQFYDYPKEVRILGNDPKALEFLQINQRGQDGIMMNSITSAQADFIVDEEDFSATVRQSMFESLMDLIGKLPPEFGLKFLPYALELSDLPNREEIVRSVQSTLGLDENGQPQPQQPQAPDPMAEAQADKVKAETALINEKIKTEQVEQQVKAHAVDFDNKTLDIKRVQTVADIDHKHKVMIAKSNAIPGKTADEPVPGHQMPGLETDNIPPGPQE